MQCPNCGECVDDGVPFCPHCGQNLEAKRRRRKLRFVLIDAQDDRRFRRLAAAVVTIIVVVAVASVLLALDFQTQEPEPEVMPDSGPPENAVVISETEYIELGGCFLDGDMTLSRDGSGQLSISLTESASRGYSSFTWTLRNESDNTSQSITKTTADLTWVSPTVGHYTVTVDCRSPGGGSDVYIGTIGYMGDRHVQYSFTHEGKVFNIHVDVSLEEYLLYSASDELRSSPSASDGVLFIVPDGCVSELAGRLRTAYVSAFPDYRTDGQEYADFVLSFVRSCIAGGSDTFYHDTGIYWAYPAETLFMGAGDPGDLAVLTASLLIASGFDAGVAKIHDEWFAAVKLRRYVDSATMPEGYHTIRVLSGGAYYYLMDITGDAPVGCVPDVYGYNGRRYTYYGDIVEGGLAVP